MNTAGSTGAAHTPRGRGRRPRLSDNKVIDRTFEAARAVLAEDGGLTVSLDHLSYEEVVRRSGVPRTAAYRIFAYNEDFYDRLLLDLAGPDWAGTAAFEDGTIALANAIVDQNTDLLQTPEGRLQLAVMASREGSKRNFDVVMNSDQWRTYVVLTSTLVSMPRGETRSNLERLMRDADLGFLEKCSGGLGRGETEQLAAGDGLRKRPVVPARTARSKPLGLDLEEGRRTSLTCRAVGNDTSSDVGC